MYVFSRHTARSVSGAALLALFLAGSATAGGSLKQGAVFTASNDATSNAVIAFQRAASGELVQAGAFPTGGAGSGAGLGNQGALALDGPGKHLLVVNAGSDTVSVFRVGPKDLELWDVAPSGGEQPISVATQGDLVYVLNAGGGGGIAGLHLGSGGQLTPLAGSVRPLSAPGVDPAQIAFSPDGRFLVVTEKDTNLLVTYAVGDDGLPGPPVLTVAEGMTPFGFAFGKKSRLLVSEAAGGDEGSSTVSSYDLLPDGTLKPITSALATTQSAACWLVTSGNGRFAYVTNTGSDTITGLSIGQDGSLTLLEPTGVTATTGAGPIDAAVSRNGKYLYVLNGDDATIDAYAIGSKGELTSLGAVGGLPAGVNGLAAL